jgi:methylated-DNA-protein-cysteine methyltransferase-like protein
MGGSGFFDKVYGVVGRIPSGSVATYGQVAALCGAPRMARFVGYALHSGPGPERIPCHRVVFRDGSICQGYAFGGPEVQRALLESEGVPFLDDTHVDLDACLWDGDGSQEGV